MVNKALAIGKEFAPPAAAAALGMYGAKMLGGGAAVQALATVAGAMVGLVVYAKFVK